MRDPGRQADAERMAGGEFPPDPYGTAPCLAARPVDWNPMPVTLSSYSKVNLGLLIGPTRPDGFHALTTLYQTLAAHDLLTVSVARNSPRDRSGESGERIAITCNDRRVPLDGRNTIWKMLALALAEPGREKLRVRVHLEKRLPVQGGLGGGSANAATALVGLERELARLGLAEPLAGAPAEALTGEARLRLAAEVGSDVPLFLLGGSVLGLGRGEQVVPLADLEEMTAVVALPDVGVSTPAAFRAWDFEQATAQLTREALAGRLTKLSRALASAWVEQHATGVLISNGISRSDPRNASDGQGLAGGPLLSTLVQTGILPNDFEPVVFRQHPLLEQIKRALAGKSSGETAVYAALSGSGSAVFGLYGEPASALAAESRLNTLGVRSLRTRTLGRAGYWAGMVVDEVA